MNIKRIPVRCFGAARLMQVKRCRLGCNPRHLSDDGRRICNKDIRRCARCRLYTFMIHKDWCWKLCGTCYHVLKDKSKTGKPGRRWRVGG